jgi:hypothetical protein
MHDPGMYDSGARPDDPGVVRENRIPLGGTIQAGYEPGTYDSGARRDDSGGTGQAGTGQTGMGQAFLRFSMTQERRQYGSGTFTQEKYD